MKKGGGSKQRGGGELTRRDRLEAELREAAGRIDEEGLVFLLEQANVLIHNARVEELRRKRSDSEEAEADAGAQLRAPAREAASMEVGADGKTVFITLGTARKVLSAAEAELVVRVCRAAEAEAEASRRLYALFARERRDILSDAGIASAQSPLLGALYRAVMKRSRA